MAKCRQKSPYSPIPWKPIFLGVWVLILGGTLFSGVSTVITMYNTLVQSKVRIEQRLEDLDGEYQRRYALINNLVALVKETKGFEQTLMEFEKQVYIQTAEAKASATKLSLQAPEVATKRLVQEDRLTQSLSGFIEKFLVMAQHYPTIPDPVLKDRTATFAALESLTSDLKELEVDILEGRKYLNDAVRIYNQNRAIFPANLFSDSWHFLPIEGFQVMTEQARQDARIAF